MNLYRYEDVQFAAPCYDDDPPGIGRLEIICHEIRIEKETPAGYWIGNIITRRWVSKTGKKRYAHPTKAEAWKSFQARKRRQIAIYSARLRRAEKALALPQPE